MEKYTSLILAAVLSLIVSTLSYFYQFGRNRKITYKERLRLLYKLAEESIDYAGDQIAGIEDLVKEVKGNPNYMPLYKTPAYPALRYLHDRVVSDEYFTAFDRLLKRCIGMDKLFFKLKLNVVYLQAQFDQIKEMTEDAIIKDNKRRKRYVQQHQRDKTTAQSLFLIQKPELEPYKDLLYSVQTKFLLQKEENDGKGNLNDIHKHFVEPIITKLDESMPPEIIPLATSLAEMTYLYKEIQFKNLSLSEDLSEMVLGLTKAKSQLIDVYDELTNPQIQTKFQ